MAAKRSEKANNIGCYYREPKLSWHDHQTEAQLNSETVKNTQNHDTRHRRWYRNINTNYILSLVLFSKDNKKRSKGCLKTFYASV